VTLAHDDDGRVGQIHLCIASHQGGVSALARQQDEPARRLDHGAQFSGTEDDGR
jgi:hypothetical protein